MSCKTVFSETEAEFLRGQRVARRATVDPSDGYPDLVPVCFVFDGVSFHTTLSRNSKRFRNTESGNKVSVLADRYEERGRTDDAVST